MSTGGGTASGGGSGGGGAPSQAAVDPASGPLGTALTVSGGSFQTGDLVRFTTAGKAFSLATVSLASSALIAMMPTSGVPTGAGSVTVERNGQPIVTAPFTVTNGKVYYIAPNGNDSAAGTKDAPWSRIDSAANKMKPGDLAYLRAGTYAGSNAPTASGTAGAPLTFMAYPGETPLLTGTLAIKGSYLTFDHLRVTNSTEFAIGVDVEVTAHDVVISNCEVYGTKGQGMIITGAHNTLLRNAVHDNGMHANQDHGIYIQGSYNTFRFNRIYNNWDYGMHFYAGSATMTGGNNLVENNYIYHNGYGAHAAGSSSTAGIILSTRHANETVRNNVICDNADFAMLVEEEPGQQIIGNVSCFNHSGGFLISPSATAVTMAGNISHLDAPWSLQASPGTTSDSATYWAGPAAPHLQWKGSDYSLAGFQAASGQDQHSKIADPHFTSVPATFDASKAASYNFCTTINPALCQN